MSWMRLDDQIAHHPKFLIVGPIASWLWVAMVGYCQKYSTDGFVPRDALTTCSTVKQPHSHAQRLVSAKLLDRAKGGYAIHDYLDYNELAVVVKERKRIDRLRKRKSSGRKGQDSRRNPSGIRAEQSSGRNPDGIRAESRRRDVQPESGRNARAGARAGARTPSHPIPSGKKQKDKSSGAQKRRRDLATVAQVAKIAGLVLDNPSVTIRDEHDLLAEVKSALAGATLRFENSEAVWAGINRIAASRGQNPNQPFDLGKIRRIRKASGL